MNSFQESQGFGQRARVQAVEDCEWFTASNVSARVASCGDKVLLFALVLVFFHAPSGHTATDRRQGIRECLELHRLGLHHFGFDTLRPRGCQVG